MSRMKWKVMRAMGKLPSSPDIRDMNDAQWAWCFYNIAKDKEEEEGFWKERLRYMGMFINPNLVYAMKKAEEEGNYVYNDEEQESDDPIYVSSDFENELKNAMNLDSEEFMEIPTSNNVYGDPNMSSDEFINSLNEIDRFNDIQNKIDQVRNDINNDLDIIEVDE